LVLAFGIGRGGLTTKAVPVTDEKHQETIPAECSPGGAPQISPALQRWETSNMSHKSRRDGRVRLTALRVGARVAVLLFSICVSAQEITVAAAADLSTALPEIVAAYTKHTGQTVKLSFGSSGNLTNQIQNGAPFDVFFSADESYPAQLIEK